MTIITLYDALTDLARAVAEKGEGYVYSSDTECVYIATELEDTFDPIPVRDESGTYVPSCIVGHSFAYRGLLTHAILDYNGHAVQFLVPPSPVNGFSGHSVIPATEEAVTVYAAAQDEQDRGETWGYVLYKARATARLL